MLNRAARFFPILRELRAAIPPGGSVLEVGSGSLGLGEFWSIPFVGCDIAFSSTPVANMLAVCGSGHQLPFRDRQFDAIVLSDVMEHVPPAYRPQVITEALRVARKIVIFGYPCGPAAFELDQKLYRDYLSQNLQPPVWLEEHMLHAFPDENIFAGLPAEWKTKAIPNESLNFHDWMMKTEMVRLWNYCLRIALLIAPGLMERWLRHADQEPSYRKIFVLTYQPEPAHA